MTSNVFLKVVFGLFFGVPTVMLWSAGCGDNVGRDADGGDDGDVNEDPACDACPDSELSKVWSCSYRVSGTYIVEKLTTCTSPTTEQAAEYDSFFESCDNKPVEYGAELNSTKPVCSDDDEPTTGTSSYSCTGWDPGAQVTLIGGVYYVDAFLVTDLVNDSTPLVACDDATVEAIANGPGFEIENANSGEALYEIGLRNGDIPLYLNSLPLDTHGDAWDAFFQLWVYESESTYELEILRGTSHVFLDYDLVFSSP